jgi:hypothetical protein
MQPTSWNRYTYTENNPINRVDPDGLAWIARRNLKPVAPDDSNQGGGKVSPNSYGFAPDGPLGPTPNSCDGTGPLCGGHK